MTASIHYFSLLDGSGYGDAAANYIQGLLQHGIQVKWTPFVPTPIGLKPFIDIPEQYRPVLENGTLLRQQLIELMTVNIDPDVMFLHAMPELFSNFSAINKPKIGITVWETTTLPKHWPSLLYQVDQIIVPCQFNRPLFSVNGGPPVHVVPHVADLKLAKDNPNAARQFRERWGISPLTYVFYNVSDWNPRKAIWETLHAFLLSFTKHDDVCFVLKTESQGYDFARTRGSTERPTREIVEEIAAAYPDPARIVLIDEFISHEEIRDLHFGADCYFSMTHSEGWGMGAFDAATTGNPVVITGWGGQCDFLSADNSFLIDYELTPVQEFINWESYTDDQKWASADIDHGISLLQWVFNHQDEAREKGKRLQKNVQSDFSSESVTPKLVEIIDGVHP